MQKFQKVSSVMLCLVYWIIWSGHIALQAYHISQIHNSHDIAKRSICFALIEKNRINCSVQSKHTLIIIYSIASNSYLKQQVQMLQSLLYNNMIKANTSNWTNQSLDNDEKFGKIAKHFEFNTFNSVVS